MISNEKRQLIEKYKGWDTCEHKRIRRFCLEINKDGEVCRLEVPAYIRKEGPRNYKINIKVED